MRTRTIERVKNILKFYLDPYALHTKFLLKIFCKPETPTLDIGCRDARYLQEMPHVNIRIGIDPEISQHSKKGNVIVLRADARCLPFRDGTFEKVILRSMQAIV